MGSVCGKHQDSLANPRANRRLFGRADFIAVITDRDIKEDYTMERHLGAGSFAQVKLAVNKRTGVREVVKRIPIGLGDKELEEMIQNEIQSLIQCDHPNIIGIRCAYKEPRVIHLVEEYIPNCQTITTLFENTKSKFSEELRHVVVTQMLHALNYMHQNKIVHRDIKSDNVVYSDSCPGTQMDPSKLEIKLIDFGFSKVSTTTNNTLNEFIGTPYYIAPEIIEQEYYGAPCDIWSLGVLTYQMICGELPFEASSKAELFKKITQGRFAYKQNIWAYVSAECRQFITACLTLAQYERPTAAQLLKHPWITSKVDDKAAKQASEEFCEQISSSLHNIRKTNSMQWTIISYMTSLNLIQSDMGLLRKEFEGIDADGNGKLSFDEIKKVLGTKLTIDQCEQVENVLKDMIDVNGSGEIDYSEFLNLTTHRQQLLSRDNLKKAFDKIDIDSNGVVCVSELRKAFEAGGGSIRSEKFWQQVIAAIDLNNDNQIQFEEFVKYMENVSQKEDGELDSFVMA
ncbi:hypothetical protein FGO68_gene14326 [Halteria grandinella]|uniref:Calmodulin n=1 Tax=Halteria grandinella TaxID=5974 RepID=A0A8J8P389_HALGN|nr:hypothetical protein FGO68_gene14326 [Halteria grandinella]